MRSMMSRLAYSTAYTTALASLGLWSLLLTTFSLPAAAAFLPCFNGAGHYYRRRHGAPLKIGGLGWDNDNFLSSLSSGKEAMDKANEAYYRRSRFGRENQDGVAFPAGRLSSSYNSNGGGDGDDYNDDNDDDDIDLSNPGALGATLTPEMIARAKASHTEQEEASQGGSMFREMMARAKAGDINRPPPPVAMTPPPPPLPFPPLPTAPFAGAAADPSSLSVEEQAALFRQMMMMQNQQQQAPPPPPAAAAASYYPPQPQAPPPPARGNYLQGGIGPDGRKIGRNRDADAINNSADVYFAQLKRDSTTRNILRRSGREDEANKVFADPAIQDIKLHINPHMEEIKRKERELVETSRDEQILSPEMLWQLDRGIKHPESYAGISYKEKMKQKQLAKQQESQQQQQQPAAAAAASSSTTYVAAPEPPAVSKPEPTAVAAAVVSAPAPAAVVPPPPPAPPAVVPPPAPQQQQQPAPMAAAPAVATTTSTAPSTVGISSNEAGSEDGMRRDIRQLMGLLLKHRGGPGFGAGRLQGAEAQRMETLAFEMTQILRQEAANAPPRPPAPAAQQQQQSWAAAVAPPLSTPGAPPPATTETSATTTRYSPSGSTENSGGRIQSMLSCMEGAITMYRNAPMELQEGILITLRSAILSAVITCNDIILDPPPVAIPQFTQPPSSSSSSSSWGTASTTTSGGAGAGGAIVQAQQTPTGDRINGMLSCIQGAITMYRNSPMELQETILVTLRSALLSAVNTCNEIIAKNEMQNYEAFRRVATDPRTRDASRPSSTLPTQFYDVIPQEQEQQQWQPPPQQQAVVATVAPSASAGATLAADSNSQVLENIYAKLQAAAGDGKMGLRPDLTPEETAELADAIADMRMLLVDELQNGIPAAASSLLSSSTATTTAAAAAESSSSSTSKYQEMLAKALSRKGR